MKQVIDTPCIGVCSTVYGDAVCRGCKRHFDEVINWNSFDRTKKDTVYQRLAEHAYAVVSQYLSVLDPKRLAECLMERGIRYRADQVPETWALQWLRFGDDTAWEAVGLLPHPPYQLDKRQTLFQRVDAALYAFANSKLPL